MWLITHSSAHVLLFKTVLADYWAAAKMTIPPINALLMSLHLISNLNSCQLIAALLHM